MRLEKLLEILRGLAPERLAEGWDHVGLQVGDPAQQVRRAMLCIDLTERVLDEAIEAGTSLIVAYHPPIFAPLSAVTSLDPKQRIILRAAQRRIAIYTPHTALDAVSGGVNDWLCEGLGKGTRRPIRPVDAMAGGTAGWQGCTQYKLVTFVPHDHGDGLRATLSAAGAGVIGDYTGCSFGVAGEGTFRGGAASNPTVGRRGRLERVAELRIEMVCPADRLTAVITALREAHPYEEPAFDLYRLETAPGKPFGADVGQGRILELDKPVSPATLIKRVKDHLGVDTLEVVLPEGVRRVSCIGVCAGAGGSLLTESQGGGGIDAFMTGEMRHHDMLAARAAGVMVMLAGHTQTERPYLKTYRRRIMAAGGKPVKWIISRADQPPSRLR